MMRNRYLTNKLWMISGAREGKAAPVSDKTPSVLRMHIGKPNNSRVGDREIKQSAARTSH